MAIMEIVSQPFTPSANTLIYQTAALYSLHFLIKAAELDIDTKILFLRKLHRVVIYYLFFHYSIVILRMHSFCAMVEVS